jgi:hypothetical protein
MIPQYNAYAPSGAKPFVFNRQYSIGQSNEANTLDNIASEFYYLYGSDIVFMPREVGTADQVFGEYLASQIAKGYNIRMFVEEVEAWAGGGDIYSKFGLQVTDECTMYINKTSFFNATASAVSGVPISGTGVYPKQGDLLYHVISKKLYQIAHVEDEIQPSFYLLGNRAGYKFQCKLFTYNYEVISQDVSANIPAAIQALDALMSSPISAGATETLPAREVRKKNAPVQKIATAIIDTSEKDPLAG